MGNQLLNPSAESCWRVKEGRVCFHRAGDSETKQKKDSEYIIFIDKINAYLRKTAAIS